MSPLSSDPAKRANQLANLSKRASGPPAGNANALRHGGYARIAEARLEAKVTEVMAALAEDAPVRDTNGEVPGHDRAMLSLLARSLCRLEDVEANVRDFGVFDQKTGALRPAVELEGRLRKEVAGYLDAMGMTPVSRARLGLDLVRTEDVARAIARLDEGGGS